MCCLPRCLLLLLLVAVAFLPAASANAQPAPGDVVVNEFLYDPPSAEGAPGEYVELLNRSDRTVDLSRFAIADSRDEPAPIASEETVLAPGDYAVLVRDGEAFAAAFAAVEFIEPGSWPQLNNGGDTAQLLYEGEVIDAVPYEPGWGGEDVALERLDPAGPSDDAENFGSSTAEIGTPGAENTLAGGDGDTTPPVLQSVTAAADRASLTAVFSEALGAASVEASAFGVETDEGSAPSIASASPVEGEPARVTLGLSDVIAPGAYTLVARDVRDAAGNALAEGRAAFAVAPGSVPDPQDVVVNELWYAPEEPALEFVELYNRSDETVDLAHFLLADDRREGSVIANKTTLLRAGEYAVLARDSAAFAGRFPEVSAIELSSWPVLNNGGDASVLFFDTDPGNGEIDAVSYEPGWGGSATASLERRDPAGPSTRATNFGSSTAPGGATPGAQNAIFARDRAAPRPVFAREAPGRAGVFAVEFSEPLDSTSVASSDFAIGSQSPSSVNVRGGGRRVRLVFGESAPSGTQLTVRGVADLTGNALAEEAGVAVAFAAAPSEERPPGELVVNEILYDPLDDDFDDRPNQPEYVELHNPTDRRLALEDYVFTDRPDEEGEADRLSIGRARASVAPGGFAVAYAADTAAGGASLRDAFPETDFSSDDVTLLPVDRSTLRLANDGGLIALRRPDGALLDSVAYRPEWQSEAVESGNGRALERLDPRGASSAAANWTTATAAGGGTPGRPNDAAPPPGSSPSEAGVEIAPSPFSPDGDGLDDVAFIRYTLGSSVSLARVRIYDSKGREVYAREAELTGREGQIPWNGRSTDGDPLRVGLYVVLFEALDADGGEVARFKEPVVLARPLD